MLNYKDTAFCSTDNISVQVQVIEHDAVQVIHHPAVQEIKHAEVKVIQHATFQTKKIKVL